MTAAFTAAVGELGYEAARAIDDLLRKRLVGLPVATYVEQDPVPWASIVDGGWDLVGVPDDDGAGLRDLVEIAKTVGRWLPPVPIVSSILAKRWSEAARGVEGPVTIALRTESGSVVVPFGAFPGIRVLTSADGDTTEVAGLVADDFAPQLRVGVGGEPTRLDRNAARELAVVWAAEAVGCAERALETAIEYVSQREQFGQPVGRFQAVKHHLADALIAAQEAESAVFWAAAEAPTVAPALELAFSSSLRTIEIAVQAHGGIGFTWELGLHMYLRHVVSLRLLALAAATIADGG